MSLNKNQLDLVLILNSNQVTALTNIQIQIDAAILNDESLKPKLVNIQQSLNIAKASLLSDRNQIEKLRNKVINNDNIIIDI